MREFAGYIRHDALGFRFELLVGEAENRVAALAQVQVALVIGLKGDGAAVVEEGVGFDHEALGAPEEVDFVAA
jgi:hypothetical protein